MMDGTVSVSAHDWTTYLTEHINKFGDINICDFQPITRACLECGDFSVASVDMK